VPISKHDCKHRFTGYTGSQGTQGYTGYTGSQGSQGSTGYTGSQGTLGYTGYTGSQGTQGYTGCTGAQGSQGSTGYTGTQGFTGSQGYTGYTGYTGTNYFYKDGTQIGYTSGTTTFSELILQNKINCYKAVAIDTDLYYVSNPHPRYILNLSTYSVADINLPNTEQGLTNSSFTIRLQNGTRSTYIFGSQVKPAPSRLYLLGDTSPSVNYVLSNNLSKTFIFYGGYWNEV
jgi:hypothetical protein